jgi:serine protease
VFFTAGGPMVDMDSHGTHVTSTIAESTNNALALAGIAYNVQIMPVKVCVSYWEVAIARASGGNPVLPPADIGGCPFDAIANGIRYAADRGAKVMNISLGGNAPATNAIQDALNYAVQHGAFVAIAGGNGFEQGNTTEYPAAYAPNLDGVMSVAATGRSRTRAYYSTTGSYIEIAAPGGNSRDGGSAGGIWQMTLTQGNIAPSIITPRFDQYSEVPFQGTSMATPHVAGVAALLISQLGSAATPGIIERMIRSTALDLGTKGKDNEFGYGLIQPRTALFGLGIRK